jgi:hypothetical protein
LLSVFLNNKLHDFKAVEGPWKGPQALKESHQRARKDVIIAKLNRKETVSSDEASRPLRTLLLSAQPPRSQSCILKIAASGFSHIKLLKHQNFSSS